MRNLLPPVLFLVFVISMALLCWSMGFSHPIGFPYNLAGLVVAAAGLALSIAGKNLFKRRHTNILTFNEPDVLVTEGVFGHTRNPMYLGFAIALMGFAILLGGAASSFLLAGLFVLITDRWYIAFEENAMRRRFGAEYDEYCRRVRRWV